MLKILLVGDKPSSKNKDPNVAFVGTKSFTTIQQWLKVMGLGNAKIVMINRVDPSFHNLVIQATLGRYKIIALGAEAKKALTHLGVSNFFCLPHPSGRNRKLNNKKYVAEILQQCKSWVVNE